MINTIILGHALNVLPKLPAESVSCVTTSPPYWGLRDYGVDPVIWDGDKNCKHIWGKKSITLKHKSGETNPGKESWFKDKGASDDKGNCFCIKCNAWRGNLGLEPTFELYIKHLCDIFDEVKRVLRKDGTCFVNIGDTYAGGGGWTGVPDDWESVSTASKQKRFDHNKKRLSVPNKSLCLIPQRFVIEMVNRGWIAHNELIWHKPNCMPSSAKKRFTVDFEPVFFFTKSNKALFWTNEKTLECVSKQPLGTKGLEGKDWEWRKVGAVDESSPNQRVRDIEKGTLQKATKEEIKNYGKIKWKKMSLWSGHDYWFGQQFEEHLSNGDSRRLIGGKESNAIYSKASEYGVSTGTRFGNNPQGRNKRAVWTIPTQPFPEAHFAVYPEALIEPMIRAGCPEFVCKKCGKARVKILKSKFTAHDGKIKSKYDPKVKDGGAGRLALLRQAARERGEEYHQELEFLGYTDCGCNAGWESGINLDPFIGAGTTALVALKQRKRFIGIEIKKEYIDMSYKRIARVQQKIF